MTKQGSALEIDRELPASDSPTPVRAACLHWLVENSARRQPLCDAVTMDGAVRSYRDLNASANRLARCLRRHGIDLESRVAICVDRSLPAVTLLLAIAKAGGTLVPIDTSHPAERARWIVEDVSPALVVADAELLELVTTAGRRPISLENLYAESLAESGDDLPDVAAPNNAAYIMYTSGSSGRPKGVVVEHASACNMLESARNDVGFTPADRVLQLAPFSFDPSIWQTFGVLAAGACVVLPPPRTERDPAAVARELRAHAVTVLIGVPIVLSGVLDAESEAPAPGLRVAVSGGSALPPALRDRLLARGLEVYNVYGPTEASIHATTHRATRADPATFVPIGAPIANMRVHVLDTNGLPVRPGAVGEIHLAGVGIARGYLNRPDLTAKQFVANTLAQSIGDRLYRTGDLGRLHVNGDVEFIGRNDDQVKIRGVRVELGEVEAVLQRHPAVAAVAALAAVTADDSKEGVVAYIVPTIRGASPDAELTKHARASLPAQAIPAEFRYLAALPLLSNGKIDRQALASLPAPKPTRAEESRPANALQALVLSAWEEALGRRDIRASDDFFSIGGTSLLAARVVAALEKRVGLRLPLDRFFAHPTVEAMAQTLRDAERQQLTTYITLSATGARAPLHFLHGDTAGLGLYCREFGPLLGNDRPIYAFPPHGADGGIVPPTIEKMALDYVASIRTLQPHGPYLIGGHCIGAIVAFEIARQLESLGERVARVILLEAQGARPKFGHLDDALASLAQVAGLRGDPVRAWSARGRTHVQRLRNAFLHTVPNVSSAASADKLTQYVDAAQDVAVKRYVWRPLSAPATMLCARDEVTDAERVRSNWSRLFSSMNLEFVPGNHETALARHRAELVSALAVAIGLAGI